MSDQIKADREAAKANIAAAEKRLNDKMKKLTSERDAALAEKVRHETKYIEQGKVHYNKQREADDRVAALKRQLDDVMKVSHIVTI